MQEGDRVVFIDSSTGRRTPMNYRWELVDGELIEVYRPELYGKSNRFESRQGQLVK